MHAAVELDTEDGNAALAGRAASRQGGRRATIYAKGPDLHHDILLLDDIDSLPAEAQRQVSELAALLKKRHRSMRPAC